MESRGRKNMKFQGWERIPGPIKMVNASQTHTWGVFLLAHEVKLSQGYCFPLLLSLIRQKNSPHDYADAASPSCRLPSWMELSLLCPFLSSPSRHCDSDQDDLWGQRAEVSSVLTFSGLSGLIAPSNHRPSACQSPKSS